MGHFRSSDTRLDSRADRMQRSHATRRTSVTTRPKALRKRAQGRPNERKNAVGPDLLLRAARELLAKLPPAQVTRAALARHAGVDPNLIRYYFKDRDSLLLSVIEEIMNEESERVAAVGGPVERLRAQVRQLVDFHQRHPYFHRLLVEEIANLKSQRARQLMQRLNQMTVKLYGAIFREGAKDKSLRALDPVLVHIAVVGACEFFMSSKLLLEDAFGKGAAPADHAGRFADTVVQVLVDGARQP